MAEMNSEPSFEELLREMTDRAIALWGEDRAGAIDAVLEQTARHLQEIGRALPPRDDEPGFYQ